MSDDQSVRLRPMGVAFLAWVMAQPIVQALIDDDTYGWIGRAAVLSIVIAGAYLVARRFVPADGIEVPKRVWQPVMAVLIIAALTGLFVIVGYTVSLPSL